MRCRARRSSSSPSTRPARRPGRSPRAPGATPLPAYCRAQSQGGTPLDIGTGEPAVKARPATAIDLSGASIAWHPRESFVRYIATGEGTSVAGGAGDPPETLPGTSAALSYTFHFPFAHGWCDPVTGSAAIYGSAASGSGTPAHGIDLVVNDPEIEIDGASSRVIFRMTGGDDHTPGGNRRQVVETLDLSRSASISVSPDARTFDYLQMPGAVPQGADTSVFAGYYLPGEESGGRLSSSPHPDEPIRKDLPHP